MEGEEKRTKRKSKKSKKEKEKEAPPPEEQQSPQATTTTTTDTKKAEEIRKKSPGKYEDINKEAKAAIGMNELFDGFRVEYNRGLADVFSVNHAFSLGSTMEPPSYNFGASYVLLGRGGPLAMLWGRIDTDSHMIGRIQSNLTSKLVLTTGVQCSNEAHQSTAHAELEYKGDDFHMQTKWLNPGNYGISYLQTITRNLAMGCDIFYNHKQGLAVATLGGRWSDGINISSVVFTYGHLTASYTRKINDRVNMCTEVVFQQAQTGLDSVWTVGAHYSFRTTNLRASLASSGKVSCIYEELINPYSKFQMCGELDHAKKQYRFGLGFQLGA